jgi:flagellar biosynthesis GTPase FlhF
MLKCPNCGQKAKITKDWSCQWCGYQLTSRAYAKEKAKQEAIEAKEKVKREAIEAKRAKEAEGRAKKEAKEVEAAQQQVKREAERAANEKARQEAEEAKEKAKREAKEAKQAEQAAKEKAKQETIEAKETITLAKKGAKRATEEKAKSTEGLNWYYRWRFLFYWLSRWKIGSIVPRYAKDRKMRALPSLEKELLGTDSEILEGTFLLAVRWQEGSKHVKQFKEHLEQIENLRIIWDGGSADKGITIAVSLQKPITLIRILNEMPLVEEVHKKGRNIKVTLTTLI